MDTIIEFIKEHIEISYLQSLDIDELKARACGILETLRSVDEEEEFGFITVEDLSSAILSQ